MPKTKRKAQKRKLSPCAVATHNKHVIFLYAVKDGSENRLVFSKSKDGLDFTKTRRFAEVFSERGKEESLSGSKDFRLHVFDNTYYLTYVREYIRFFSKKVETVIAVSADLKEFDVVKRMPGTPLEALAIVSGHKHKVNALAYHGKESIYVSVSSNFEHWHSSGRLLSPRKDHFDSKSLHVIDALATEKGILVLYEANKGARGKRETKIGAALFCSSQPYKILWRSDDPIWEKELGKDSYPAKSIGAVLSGGFLRIYWMTKKKETVAANISLSSLGLKKLKKSPVQLKRHQSNPILKPDLKNFWECDATFNPAAVSLKDKVHLLYRAIGGDGLSVFGYASSSNGFEIDERFDRPAYAAMKTPKVFEKALTLPRFNYASGGSWVGCEDPRLTKIGNRIYLVYVSFDGCCPPGVALTSIDVKDFLKKDWKWRKPVLISRPGQIQKNWVLFPQKIKGKYAILHSITPNISIEYVDDLDKGNFVIDSEKKQGKNEHRWDNIMRGAGAPPIKTKYGWLVLYHAMDKRDPDKYKVGAMLLDHDNPEKILYRSRQPILEPEFDYENNGAKSGVVYVCGAVIKGDTLFVYYGGSDSVVCVATADAKKFLEDLVKSKPAGKRAMLKKVKS